MKKILFFGGGKGLRALVHQFRIARNPDIEITITQTVYDSGGNSGELRKEYSMLPPGDIGNAMLALCDEEQMQIAERFLDFRFPQTAKAGLSGASGKNLVFLIFYLDAGCNFMLALRNMSAFLRLRGKILPVTLDDVHLEAIWSDGKITREEGDVDKQPLDGSYIKSVRLNRPAATYYEVLEAIEDAHRIVVCPGSHQTSIIATTLSKGFREAMINTSAKVDMVTNLVSDPRESPSRDASASVREVLRAIGRNRFDTVYCNTAPFRYETEYRYAQQKSFPIMIDSKLYDYASRVIEGNFMEEVGGKVRHNAKVAKKISEMCMATPYKSLV